LIVGITPKEHIWIWDVVRQAMTPLTFDEGTNDSFPLWTPDGKRIVYCSTREGEVLGDIYWKASDGTGKVEKLASSPGRGLIPQSWSKDGKSLVLTELTSPTSQTDIGMLSMEGDNARKPLLNEKYSEGEPRISPDGRWMAYQSNESGKAEVYVRPFPEVNKARWQVSMSGGSNPLWSPDGRELFYHSGDAAMAVRVETDPTFKPGKPTVLFRGTQSKSTWADYTFWDISPNGKRFLMLKEAAVEAPSKISVVVNWIEELKQRVPGK
jgi:serine/threonine-protein kinase